MYQAAIVGVPTLAVFIAVQGKTRAERDETLNNARNKRLLNHRNDPEKVKAMDKLLFQQSPEEMKGRFLPDVEKAVRD